MLFSPHHGDPEQARLMSQGCAAAKPLAALVGKVRLAAAGKFPIIPKGYSGLVEQLLAVPSHWWNYGELWGIMLSCGGIMGELWGIWVELWGIWVELWGIMVELWGIMGNFILTTMFFMCDSPTYTSTKATH